MPRGWPDAHYKQVAEVYQEAFEETFATGHAVAETYGVPLTTAHRWIKEARRRGFIGPIQRRCSCRCPVHCPNAQYDGSFVPRSDGETTNNPEHLDGGESA